MAGPNNSTDKMLAAMGALAAPASKLTIPIAEKVARFRPKIWAINDPAVAPMKKIGVTMPPLPPKLRVMLVKIIFMRKAYQTIFSPRNEASMVFSPNPRYCVEK